MKLRVKLRVCTKYDKWKYSLLISQWSLKQKKNTKDNNKKLKNI